jgi:predicted SAM-dependent methyltransferase
MKLNLGCQVHYFEGWVNQDIIGDDPNMRVDMVCDANTLPYENDTVDFIYAGHLVEHYYPDTLAVAVAEWKRVLRPGGKLVIVTPDCGSVFRDYADYDRESERHHIAFDPTQLLRMVDSPSWTYATPMDFQRVPEELEPFMDAHISRGAYQLGVILTK